MRNDATGTRGASHERAANGMSEDPGTDERELRRLRSEVVAQQLRAWKTRACLLVRSRGVSARLYKAETASGGDRARCGESTQDILSLPPRLPRFCFARTPGVAGRTTAPMLAAADTARAIGAPSIIPKARTASSGRRGRVLTSPPSMPRAVTRRRCPRPRAVPTPAVSPPEDAPRSQCRRSSTGETTAVRARRWSRFA